MSASGSARRRWKWCLRSHAVSVPGVDRAIEIVERALAVHGAPIYVRHEIVHNNYVVDDLRTKGAVFIDELEGADGCDRRVFRARGRQRQCSEAAQQRGLHVFDATCPLVTKVHVEVAKMRAAGREIVMIGHLGHPEVEGTMGQSPKVECTWSKASKTLSGCRCAPELLAYVTQTTLSLDDAAAVIAALKRRFPSIAEPKKADICYATQNRQDAVKFMAPQVDVVIVVGSENSSNSNRLREVAQRFGVPAYLVDNADQLDPEWLPACAELA